VEVSGAEVVALHPMTIPALVSTLASHHSHFAAVIYFVGGYEEGRRLPLEEVIRVAHEHNVPVIVDAAAQLPPVANLWKFTGMGVYVVLFSGGKAIRGPQDTGLILGRTDIIHAARLNGSPHEQAIGRPMKCSKEAIAGFVAALQAFVREGDADDKKNEEVVQRLMKSVSKSPGVRTAHRVFPGHPSIQPNTIPRLYIDLPFSPVRPCDADSVDHGNPMAIVPDSPPTVLAHRLAKGEPGIVVHTSAEGIVINPQTLTLEEVDVVSRRIRDELNAMVNEGIIPRSASAKL